MTRAAILIIEDDPLQRRLTRENLEREGYDVLEASSGREALALIARFPVDLAVVDYKLENETGLSVIEDILKRNPLITTVMVSAYGNIETAVQAMKRGAYDYITKPIDFANLLVVIERALERQRLRAEVSLLRENLEERFSARNFVFASTRMEEVAHLVAKAAQSDATVLIAGETGTGKDLVAKTVHYSSRRKNGPFLTVNVPSLPETLLESELFGSEKGAYTGAHERKIGKFEAAGGGTLFLDEIGDLPLQAQVKLLRFLQDKEFFRLGSSSPLKADVRIIAATNKDIEKMMEEGKFRADLYYRLNVVHIETPPLRQRKEDIPSLVDHFIKKYGEREGKSIEGISREAMDALVKYSYPGNIRELENIIERGVVFSDGGYIRLSDLPLFLKEKGEAEISEKAGSLSEKVERLETMEIQRALLDSGGIKSRAARALGVTERILSYKMKLYGIRPGK